MSLQELKTCRVMGVVEIDVGVERTSVDDQSDAGTSAARISSIRSETSERPLLPAPAAKSRRLVPPPPRCASMAWRVNSETVVPRRSASCRSRASSSSGSFTEVRLMVCQHTHLARVSSGSDAVWSLDFGMGARQLLPQGGPAAPRPAIGVITSRKGGSCFGAMRSSLPVVLRVGPRAAAQWGREAAARLPRALRDGSDPLFPRSRIRGGPSVNGRAGCRIRHRRHSGTPVSTLWDGRCNLLGAQARRHLRRIALWSKRPRRLRFDRRRARARSALDIGCGTGTFACLLANRGKEVTAVDPAAASVAVAQRKAGAERVRWLVGDAGDLLVASGPRCK
jgi:hypothetical protein